MANRFLSQRPIGTGPIGALALLLATVPLVSPSVTLVQISADPYTNSTSQHKTQVEPDTFSFGSTIVAATQSGRFTDGGSSNIGWATSTDNGNTWTNGFLPGTTVYAAPAGPYARISDPSVAYDPYHNVWLITGLALNASVTGAAVTANRSTDGGFTWQNPINVSVASGSANYDKDWVTCDTTSTSPYYGHCYVEWDNNGAGNKILMSTSSDGGLTWGPALQTANGATGIGGQPLVQPSGTVVVPIDNAFETSVIAFTSSNGGASWSSTVKVAAIKSHTEAGNLRSGPLPSAEIDGSGTVYLVWADCRFESRCTANDIILTTSTNGTTWTAPIRIPIDAVGSKVDHFLPGLAVDKNSSGSTAHLGLVYYYYPQTSCTSSTCQLDAGLLSSTNGGSTWSSPTQLTGPITLSWLASTTQGQMAGDYMSASIGSDGLTHPGFINAFAPSGSTFNEALYSTVGGLAASGAERAVNPAEPVLSAGSDHAAPLAPVMVR